MKVVLKRKKQDVKQGAKQNEKKINSIFIN